MPRLERTRKGCNNVNKRRSTNNKIKWSNHALYLDLGVFSATLHFNSLYSNQIKERIAMTGVWTNLILASGFVSTWCRSSSFCRNLKDVLESWTIHRGWESDIMNNDDRCLIKSWDRIEGMCIEECLFYSLKGLSGY